MFDGIYRGAVHDINDPENRGRLRALVPAALGEAVSGWAEPVLPTPFTPAWSVGDKVWVMFEGGDLNKPVYISRMQVEREDLAEDAVLPSAGQTFSTEPPPADVTDYPEGYGWWRLVDIYAPKANPEDPDVKIGEGVAGFWRLEGGVWQEQNPITVDALRANNVLVIALTGQTVTGATLQTRDAPLRGIKLGDVDGVESLIVYNESGVPFLKAIPAEELAVIAGEVKASSLTVTGGSSLGGDTEISRAQDGTPGILRLTAYTTAPKSAPVVTTKYDTLQFENPSPDGSPWDWRVGLAWSGTHYYTTVQLGSGGWPMFTIERWNPDGTFAVKSESQAGVVHGITYAAGSLFVLWEDDTQYFWVSQYSAATLAYEHNARWIHSDTGSTRRPAIGFDSNTGELIIAQARTTNPTPNTIRFRRYTMPFTPGDNLTAGSFVDSADTHSNWLTSVLYGTFDFAGGDYKFVTSSSGAGDFWVYGASTGTVDAASQWQSGSPNKIGFVWAGNQFKVMTKDGLLRSFGQQDKDTGIGGTDLIKWVSSSLVRPDRSLAVSTTTASNVIGHAGNIIQADVDALAPISGAGIQSGTTITARTATTATLSLPATATSTSTTVTITRTIETDQSPRYKVTVPKRSKIQITPSRINLGGTNSADRARIYIAKGPTDPGRLYAPRQSDPPLPDALGITTVTYDLISEGQRFNLVHNPSFEVNTNGWLASAGTTIARSTAQAYTGSASLALTHVSGLSMSVSSYGPGQGFPVTPELPYTAQFRSRAATTARNVRCGLFFYNAVGTAVAGGFYEAGATNTTTGWSLRTHTITAPAGAVYARVVPLVELPAVGEVHYIDAVMLEQSATALPYFDGNTATSGQTAYGFVGGAWTSSSREYLVPPSLNGFQQAGGTIQRFELADGSLFVDALGNSGQPSIGLRAGAVLSVPTNAWTVVPLTVVDHLAGDLTATQVTGPPATTVVNVVTAGTYNVSGGVFYTASNNATERVAEVEWWVGTDPGLSGGNIIFRPGMSGAGSGVNPGLYGSTDVFLPSGAKVRLLTYQASGAALSVGIGTTPAFLNLRRVG